MAANAGADLFNSIKAAKDFNITPGQTIVPLVGATTETHALGAAASQGMILVEPLLQCEGDHSRQRGLPAARHHAPPRRRAVRPKVRRAITGV
jgi:hypothetical protein